MGNQSGFIKFKTALILLFIAGGVYVAAKLGPPYVQNYRIQKLVERAASNMGNPERRPTISTYLQKQIHYMDLPFKWDEFQIERDGPDVWVWITWDHEVVWIPENSLVPSVKRTLYFQNEGVAEYQE